MKTILVTGGAGFVGSSICLWLKELGYENVLAFDNLKRRGSELSLKRLQAKSVKFIHGDVRNFSDFEGVGKIDLLIDCAAEPSVLAGIGESPRYVIDTNLNGTINCLEYARMNSAAFLFLSTSRIYPIEPLSKLNLIETETRFDLANEQELTGVSREGVKEEFALEGSRSIYGATKLSSEFIFREYIESYKMSGLINRCGVLTGPWQMGKIDQGVVVLWVARHIYQGNLSYIGFNGSGKQVRDILHVSDLCSLLEKQIKSINNYKGEIYNVGGGLQVSVSLKELTQLCQQATANKIAISSVVENRANDIPWYLTDCAKVKDEFSWQPQQFASGIIDDIAKWITDNREELKAILN